MGKDNKKRGREERMYGLRWGGRVERIVRGEEDPLIYIYMLQSVTHSIESRINLDIWTETDPNHYI